MRKQITVSWALSIMLWTFAAHPVAAQELSERQLRPAVELCLAVDRYSSATRRAARLVDSESGLAAPALPLTVCRGEPMTDAPPTQDQSLQVQSSLRDNLVRFNRALRLCDLRPRLVSSSAPPAAAVAAVDAFCASPSTAGIPSDAHLLSLESALPTEFLPSADGHDGQRFQADAHADMVTHGGPTINLATPPGSAIDGGATAGAPAVGDASSLEGVALNIMSVAIQGLANFLETRMRAELQTSMLGQLQDSLCPALESSCSQAASRSDEQRRDCAYSVFRRIMLQTTCTFLANQEFTLSASFGGSFQAAVGRDIYLIPQHLFEAMGDDMVRGAAFGTDYDADLRSTLTLAAFDAMLRSSSQVMFVDRLLHAVETLSCDSRGASVSTPRCDNTRRDLLVAVRILRTTLALSSVGASEIDRRASAERALGLSLRHRCTALFPGNNASQQSCFDGRQRFITPLVNSLIGLDAAFNRLGIASSATRRAEPVTSDASRSSRDASTPTSETVRPAVLVAQHAIDALELVQRLTLAEGVGGVEVPQELTSFVSAVVAQNTPRAVVTGLALGGRYLGALRLPTAVVRALNFGGDLLAARPDDVAGVIEQLSAPLGGWRGKSHRGMASMTAMVGVTTGFERSLSTTILPADAGEFVAPMGAVGFDFSLPLCPNNSNNWGSLGLFVPVLDVGALLTASSTAPQPMGTMSVRNELNPLQFVTPGLFFRWGLPALPLVFGAGATIAPASRSIVVSGADRQEHTETLAVVRGQLFLAVDVTILPL